MCVRACFGCGNTLLIFLPTHKNTLLPHIQPPNKHVTKVGNIKLKCEKKTKTIFPFFRLVYFLFFKKKWTERNIKQRTYFEYGNNCGKLIAFFLLLLVWMSVETAKATKTLNVCVNVTLHYYYSYFLLLLL